MDTEASRVAPPEWDIHSVAEVCTQVTSGGTPSRRNPSFYTNGVCPWVKTQELHDGWIHDTEEHITHEALAASSAKLLPEETVLVAMYGATVGKLGILRRPMSCNQACSALVVDPIRADYRYLFYQLMQARSQLRGLATGAAQQNLSGKLIKALRFPFPKIREQRAIAHVLGTLDDKIELNRRMNETLEAMARAIFQDWFVDFGPVRAKLEGKKPYLSPELWSLFPDRLVDSELGEIPEEWKVEALGEFATVSYGAPFASMHFNQRRDGLPLLRIRDLATHDPSIFTDEHPARGQLIRAGDIVVGMDGEFRAHIWKGPVSWLNQRVCCLKPHCGVPRAFLFESLIRPLADFERSKVGTTVIHLGKADIGLIKLIRPPVEILRSFDDLSEPIVRKLLENTGEIRLLSALRDTLLPKMVSGELPARSFGLSEKNRS